ncbi:alpha/beta hydrolase [Butyrivibrio sp. NC3005]|uniref:alpha/beta hydrolase n=1 Tax=Butyrivibrio sp. NC3005 TaxID=1280685 RepID=UPI0003FDFB8B|nr:alpha/beta hydrolase [Butyrivibrio sp. NC3005]
MKKKANVVTLGLLSALFCGGIFAGNELYRIALQPRQHGDDDKDASEEVTKGRFYVRNHANRRDIYIDAIDNLRLHATFIPSENSKEHHYVLLVHGVSDNSESMGIYAKEYEKKGYNMLLPDLRGFGQSEGDYIGYGGDDRFDIIEWIYWIIKHDKDARILLHGMSMGAATVLMTTGEHLPENVIGAISDSAYTDVRQQFVDVYTKKTKTKSILPIPLAMMLLRLEVKLRAGYDFAKIKPIKAIENSNTPTLFMHGDADVVIKPSMCKELYKKSKGQNEYAMILGAGHIDGVWYDPKEYWGRINVFLDHIGY